MGKLFGTDGVRGKANKELTPELAFKLGQAGAFVLTKANKRAPKILVGMDSRISGDMLESALIAGMCSVGTKVVCVGIIPTPAIAFLVRKYNLDAGAMISASHNPFYDNGIKFFDQDGYKLKDELEEEIETYIFDNNKSIELAINDEIGNKTVDKKAKEEYINFIKSTIGGKTLDGLKIALDCANGATSEVAPAIFEELGAEVLVINNTPNGKNINDNCGSTHLEGLVGFVKNNKVDLGFAFDGDGDRLMSIDEKGNIIDGDQILSILSNHMKNKGTLKNDTVVVTVMSNLGFMQMADKMQINAEVTTVGDRYVLEKMLEKGYNLGGEQSGHIIFLDHNSTGDGILSAVQLCSILKEVGGSLSELNKYMTVLPQVLINVRVENDKKHLIDEDDIIQSEIAKVSSKFINTGRVLIRPSGTEPVVRIMIEGENEADINEEANRLAKIFIDRLK